MITIKELFYNSITYRCFNLNDDIFFSAMKLRCKYISTFILLFIFFIAGYHGVAQEICNNGIDDDSDGLADLYDPDCQCHFIVTDNFLLNGSFEMYNHCPVTYTYDKDYNIADYWQFGTNTNEADYYHNLKCAYDSNYVMSKMPPAKPLPQGDGFISIQNISAIDVVDEKNVTKNYVGQCLQKPLKKDSAYTLSFYAGRFKAWDNLTGKIFPFTVAVFGNTDCKAVPFGKANALGNGCPTNYPGWIMLGKITIYISGQWVQNKINFTAPEDVNVIEIGPDCSILPPITDLPDNTTFYDYHVYYLDDLHLLPTKDFPFQYIHTKIGIDCKDLPVLEAPATANATYQWYKDSIAIKGAANAFYQVQDNKGTSYYNVLITTNTKCITSEPFLITASKLSEIRIPTDTAICNNTPVQLAPAFAGITYTINGAPVTTITVNKKGLYNITAIDVYGCNKTFNVNVSEENCSDCNAYVPNAFTPNADGLNDLFKPKFYCHIPEFRFKIYNRWGEKIFESGDVNKGWDGTYAGLKLPVGSYVYFIKYKTISGIIKTVKGMVALVM